MRKLLKNTVLLIATLQSGCLSAESRPLLEKKRKTPVFKQPDFEGKSPNKSAVRELRSKRRITQAPTDLVPLKIAVDFEHFKSISSEFIDGMR